MTNQITTEDKISRLQDVLSGKLASAENAVLLWSGGMDSTLLLFLILEICPEITVIQLRADFTPEQLEFSNRIIREKQIRTIYYFPKNRTFVKSTQGVSLVDEYSIGESCVPVIRDLVHSDNNCALHLNPRRTPHFDFKFDLAIVGWRKTDAHELLKSKLPETLKIADCQFFAPLYEISKEEIAEMSDFLEIPQSDYYKTNDPALDTGNFVACSRCLGTKEKVFCPKKKEKIGGADWVQTDISFVDFNKPKEVTNGATV